MLIDAQPDLLSFAAFPRRHWHRICDQPLERVNKEIKRRTDVVGVFPNSAAVMLELAVMNNPVEVIDEAVILPELAVAQTRTTDPHRVEKRHHSAGGDR